MVYEPILKQMDTGTLETWHRITRSRLSVCESEPVSHQKLLTKFEEIVIELTLREERERGIRS